MIISYRFQFFLVIFIIAVTACSPKVKYPIALPKQNIAMDIITLSSDEMEGREIGTEGEKKAAEYISNRFKTLGLTPMGDNQTYFQHFTRKMNKNPHGDDTGVGPEVKGKNVVGFVNNNAKTTVIIGGHYDHLGYGQEGSLHTGELTIHNGADDNASGVAGVLYLAEAVQKAGLKNHNYLFICFSGEEKGLWGSNYFINHTSLNKSTFNYMVNMDMIGRLNDERKLSISGIGTSPIFESVIDGIKTPKFSIKKEFSGLGPSDQASFYNAEIPVLAFFTGQHSDYHKPSDDHQYINYSGITDIVQYIYNVVSTLDKNDKLPFVKTKDESQTRMAFSVTLGVMPDYMYDGKGMKIDGTKDGKAANLAGIQKGDIVIKMGELDVPDMQSYMKCLTLFKPGQTVDVTILREGKELVKKVTF
jgi:hypothetical protein